MLSNGVLVGMLSLYQAGFRTCVNLGHMSIEYWYMTSLRRLAHKMCLWSTARRMSLSREELNPEILGHLEDEQKSTPCASYLKILKFSIAHELAGSHFHNFQGMLYVSGRLGLGQISDRNLV
jgi:hypothetical protein